MDTNQPASTTVYVQPPSSPGLFGSKIPSSVAFIAGILLFLLPFAEIRCGSSTITQKSGLDFVMKKDWKPASGDMFGGKEMAELLSKANAKKDGPSWMLIIASLGLGIVGLILSVALNSKAGATGGLISGALSAGALIAMMMQLKKEFKDLFGNQVIDKAKEGADNVGLDKIGNTMNDVKPILAITPWFYITIIAFLAAAFFCYRRMAASKN